MIAVVRLILLRLVLLTAGLIITTASYATESYVVTYVYDGDTVKLSNINGEFKLRLTDIDAPERNQSYGKKSSSALKKLCKGKHTFVTAQLLGIDKYNRYLGKLQCNEIDASLYLVEHGLAWHNAKYSNDVAIFNAASRARQQRLGLWKSKNPMPPWIWRQKHAH